MPIRSLLRDDGGADPAERVLANHLGNVRVLTLDLLQLRLHHAHLVDVLDEPLRTGVVADDALPAGRQGHLAPLAALRARELDVDERPRAVDRAPLADGLDAGRARVSQRRDGVEAPEARRLAALAPVAGAERGADGAGFAGVRVQNDFGVGYLAPDEVHLRLDHGHVAVGAALQDELAAGGPEILELARVDPHVDRQHRRQRGHDLLGRPALALLVDDVRLEEDAAAHREARHRLGLERAVGVGLERDVVALGHALQEGAVAGRALRVQPEVGDGALPQDHDLDVGAAHVADHVGVGVEVERGGRVGDRLHHTHVGAQDVLQEILAVAGERERTHVGEPGVAYLAEQRLGVLDRVALAEGVTGEQELAVLGEHDRLGGGRAEIAAEQHAADVLRARAGSAAGRRRLHVLLHEPRQNAGARHQATGALLGLRLMLAFLDPPLQLVAPLVDADLRLLALPDLDAAETGVIERLGRHHDERGRLAPAQIDLPLGPELRQVMAPRLLESLEEEVGAAEQQHLGRRRVALGQRGQVLVDDRLEQAGDDLLDRHPGLHQSVRVGLGEDAALARDLVQGHALVGQLGQPLAGHLQLARGLLDEGTGAAAAGRLHVHLLRSPGPGGGEEDRLHVLAADLRDEAHVGMLALDTGGDGHDLLDELGAHLRRDEARTGPGEEDAILADRKPGLGLHPREELEDLLGLASVVPLVILPADLAVLHHHRLDGGGPDVDAGEFHDCLEKGAPPPSRLPRELAGASAPPPSRLPCERAGASTTLPSRLPCEVALRRPILWATWRTSFAAVPAAVPSWGIGYVAFFIAGCACRYARTSSTLSPVRSSTSSNSRWARFLASVRIIWQRDSAWTSASPLISSGA